MHSLKFEDYEYIFEYDTDEEFDKKLEDGIKTYERLQEIKTKKQKANEILEKWTNRKRNSWFEIEARFLQSIKNQNLKEFTYKSYASSFKELQNYFNYAEISSKSEDYNEFIEALKNKNVENETINEFIDDINVFLDFAYENDFIEEKICIHKIKKSREIKYTKDHIEKIQAKKVLTVQELEVIYSIKKTTQQNYRSRIHDPLPYHQKVENGKITYLVDEVEKWIKNQHR